MRLSAKAQYALVAMVELAGRYGERHPVQLKRIAEDHGISPRFLVQILLQLKARGLVESIRGAAGGYHLAMPPANITVGEIIHSIEETPPIIPSALCGLRQTSAVQAIGNVLQEAQLVESRRFNEINLADLLEQGQPNSFNYQI